MSFDNLRLGSSPIYYKGYVKKGETLKKIILYPFLGLDNVDLFIWIDNTLLYNETLYILFVFTLY